MQIEKDKVVSFHYALSEDGKQLETSRDGEPMLVLHGHGGVMVGLEEAMAGKAVGDTLNVTLEPAKAYGERQDDAQQRIPIKHLVGGKKLKLRPGMVVSVNTDQGPRDVTVIKAGKFNVDVDLNHPLAGKTLTFDVEILDIRDATAEELSHGHAHGVGGHQH